MVGLRTLDPAIMVRIHVPQLIKKSRKSGFFYEFV